MSKIKKVISGTVSALMIASSVPTVVSAADQQTRGNIGGFDYEMWNQNGQGQVSMNPGAGSFSCSWSNIENFLARMGKNYDSQKKNYKAFGDITLSYDVEYTPRGNSYMCVYGWTRNPLMEYYIVEGWGDWRPPGNDGERKGTVTLDGHTYDIAKTMRYNQPSLDGTATFPQYWSIRQQSGSANNQTNYMKGTISVSKHFDAWSQAGLDMSGTLYEVSLNIEGYRSNGSANVKSISFDGSPNPQPDNNTNTNTDTNVGGGQQGGFDFSQFGGGQQGGNNTQPQNDTNTNNGGGASQKSGTIKIMPVGDSITNGDGEQGGYRKYLYDALTKKGYKIDMVGPNGKNSASANGISYDDNHAGYSGYQIKEVPSWGQQQGGKGSLYNELKNANAVKQAQPDIILLMIGTNDLTANRSMDACASDLRAMLDYMLADMPSDGVIFLCSVPEHTAYGGNTQKIGNYNSTVKQVAEEYAGKGKNVKFADVHGCLDGMNDIGGDQLHPNGGGYKKIGNFFAGVIDEYEAASAPVVTTTTTAATTTTTTTTKATTTTTAATTTTAPALKATKAGDANCDGEVDMSDVVLVMQAFANPNKFAIGGSDAKALTPQGEVNADVDKASEGLTPSDALTIQKFLLGMIKSL
ncbi:glycoside hydrolase family 11 protein [Ruminococcus flavefaciens]|uniref:glycoside hydrolase family 11 protein n=1 Tax=Ruminococcus flavefaciens TaxID=1265 RepID=UPI0026EFED1D|nr:glycoside hydrolase family 11 protein [Ruminococcus flavefaciens]